MILSASSTLLKPRTKKARHSQHDQCCRQQGVCVASRGMCAPSSCRRVPDWRKRMHEQMTIRFICGHNGLRKGLPWNVAGKLRQMCVMSAKAWLKELSGCSSANESWSFDGYFSSLKKKGICSLWASICVASASLTLHSWKRPIWRMVSYPTIAARLASCSTWNGQDAYIHWQVPG